MGREGTILLIQLLLIIHTNISAGMLSSTIPVFCGAPPAATSDHPRAKRYFINGKVDRGGLRHLVPSKPIKVKTESAAIKVKFKKASAPIVISSSPGAEPSAPAPKHKPSMRSVTRSEKGKGKGKQRRQESDSDYDDDEPLKTVKKAKPTKKLLRLRTIQRLSDCRQTCSKVPSLVLGRSRLLARLVLSLRSSKG